MSELLSKEELSHLKSLGFIPGPKESKEVFLNRVSLAKTPSHTSPLTQEIFGFTAKALRVLFSRKGLMPWQGGCTTIDETSCVVQLKKERSFFYSADEIIAHEGVHVARMAFDEPKYEEILAYQTSRSSFRRYFGPIVQSSKEAACFVVSVGALLLAHFAALCWPKLFFFPIFLFVLVLGQTTFSLVRLVKRQNTFKRCLNNVQKGLKKNDQAREIALHLTDTEIELFAQKNAPAFLLYAQRQNSLRWAQIKALVL